MSSYIHITSGDLIYINNIGKILKHKNFIWYRNILLGTNDESYAALCAMDPSILSVIPDRAILINQRNLSKFVGSITTQEGFPIPDMNRIAYIHNIYTDSEELSLQVSNYMDGSTIDRIQRISAITDHMQSLPEADITDMINQAILESKATGVINLEVEGHGMQIPTSVIPVNKSDLVYLTIYDGFNRTFTSRFRITKKITDLMIYMSFLSI